MNKTQLVKMLLFFWFVAFLATNSTALADEVKERMRARLPAINDLKDKGIVGENNLGFLELKGPAGNSAELIKEENADRRKVYAAIAGKQGATVPFVGKRRALQIAENADPGHWLQNEAGQWYKK